MKSVLNKIIFFICLLTSTSLICVALLPKDVLEKRRVLLHKIIIADSLEHIKKFFGHDDFSGQSLNAKKNLRSVLLAKDEDGDSAFLLATREGNLEIIKEILEKCPDDATLIGMIYQKNNIGFDAEDVAQAESEDLISDLIYEQIEKIYDKQFKQLYNAILAGNMDDFKEVLSGPFKNNLEHLFVYSDESDRNLIHAAASIGGVKIARYILKNIPVASIVELFKERDDLKQTPLDIAEKIDVKYNKKIYLNLIKIYLELEEDKERLLEFLLMKDGDGNTLLHRAAKKGGEVKEVIEGEFNKILEGQSNLLRKAILDNNLKSVDAILEVGPFRKNLNYLIYYTDKSGQNIIHWLAENGSIELATDILKDFDNEHRINFLEQEDSSGKTPFDKIVSPSDSLMLVFLWQMRKDAIKEIRKKNPSFKPKELSIFPAKAA